MINAIRAHLAEFGIVAPVGRNGVEHLLDVVADASDKRLPEVARACLLALGAQLRTLKAQILNFDRQIMAWHRSNEASKRLDEIPGVGPALATALVASVADPEGSAAQIAIALFADATELVLPSARVLLRHEPESRLRNAAQIEKPSDPPCQDPWRSATGLGSPHCWHGGQ